MVKSLVLWSLAAALAGGAPGADAAELELQGPELLVSGPLDGENAAAFAAHLSSGAVRTVVFEDSAGGLFDAAERYAAAIRAAGVATEARGQCHDACAYAFLAGRTHRFARGMQVNSLLIPLRARAAEGDLGRTLVEFSAPPATDAASPAAPTREPWVPMQGLLVTSTPTLFGRIHNSHWCDGTQGRDISRCTLMSEADPFTLGILSP